LHLVLGLALLQGPLEDHLEPGGIERLLDEVEDAFAHRPHRRVDGALARDDDHRGLRRFLAQRPGERQAVELGHHQVADDHVGMELGGQFQGVVAVARLLDVVAPALEQLAEELAGGCVVVHDQDARLHAAVGSRLDGHGAAAAYLGWLKESERRGGAPRGRGGGRTAPPSQTPLGPPPSRWGAASPRGGGPPWERKSSRFRGPSVPRTMCKAPSRASAIDARNAWQTRSPRNAGSAWTGTEAGPRCITATLPRRAS